MTAALAELPITPNGPMIRESARRSEQDVRKRAYRQCPVGSVVGRYIRNIEYAGYAETTVESYEQVLGWLAIDHDDFADISRFCAPDGPEFLEDFLARRWGGAAEKTRSHHCIVLNVFFAWVLDKHLIPYNPMAGIKGPRNPKTLHERNAYKRELVIHLIDSQPELRERVALGLLRLALRKNDLRLLQLRDIDLGRDVVRLNHSKGGERHRLPILFKQVRQDISLHLHERTEKAGGADIDAEYLLYPKTDRDSPMSKPAVHRWFKRCLARADLPDSIQMHELRHTAGDDIHRVTGDIVQAQKFLRHKSPGTTANYLHPTEDDLRGGMKRVDEAWEESRE